MSDKAGNPTFAQFAEAMLDPIKDAYSARRFDEFIRQTRDVECVGCGQTALADYIVLDPGAGLLKCPRCYQTSNLKTMMKAWVGLTAESLEFQDFFKNPFN